MAFTPVNLPIQEMLQSDFIVDLAQIHNSNVLLLKDKLEDVINNFEFDTNTISIGTDNPINSIRTQDIVIQDGGFIFQTGVPNQIIARLFKNGSDESVLNVDNITVDSGIDADNITINDITINNSATFAGPVVANGSFDYEGSLIESKESVSVLVEKVANTAVGTITLSNTSRKNIYVTLTAETTVGPTRVWDGSAFVGTLTDIILNIDFDATNPPAENTSFTIHIVDVVENSGSVSIVSNINAVGTPPPVQIATGVNQSTTGTIIMHHDLVAEGQKLAVNHQTNAMFQSQALLRYGHNATFNYIIDNNSNDRLLITSMVGLEIY